MNRAAELPTVPDSGLARELFDLVVDMAADLEKNRLNSEERRKRIARMFGIAKGLQAIEAGGAVFNAVTGDVYQAAGV